MDCETAKDLLGPYYDDELDPAERDLVARHVENCSSCARELESLAKLDRDSRLLFAPEPPLDIWDSVESRLATRETKRSAVGRAFSRRQLTVAIGAVAVSAVGVFVASTIGRRDQKPVVPELVRPAQHISIAPNALLVDMADMSPEDRHLIQLQKFCATTNATNRWESAASRSRLCCRTRPYYLSAVTNVSFGCESIRRKPSRKPSRLNTASCGNFTTVPARSVPNAKRRPCHNRPTRLTVPRGD